MFLSTNAQREAQCFSCHRMKARRLLRTGSYLAGLDPNHVHAPRDVAVPYALSDKPRVCRHLDLRRN